MASNVCFGVLCVYWYIILDAAQYCKCVSVFCVYYRLPSSVSIVYVPYYFIWLNTICVSNTTIARTYIFSIRCVFVFSVWQTQWSHSTLLYIGACLHEDIIYPVAVYCFTSVYMYVCMWCMCGCHTIPPWTEIMWWEWGLQSDSKHLMNFMW